MGVTDIVILCVVSAAFAAAVIYLIVRKVRRKGGCGCGCDCGCEGCPHCSEQKKK